VLLIPYGIGALSAVAAKGSNESSWLYVPVAGPWLTMGLREYGSCQRPNTDDSLRCVADIFVVMGLIFDGVIQVTGGTLLLVGYLNTKQELVRDEAALRIRPVQVGSGYGLRAGAWLGVLIRPPTHGHGDAQVQIEQLVHRLLRIEFLTSTTYRPGKTGAFNNTAVASSLATVVRRELRMQCDFNAFSVSHS
jgi:hypothetical protein